MDTARHVLFLCTGNSARSILAEGLMNHLGAPRFQAHSEQPGAPELAFVFTVCDNAAGELCPVWPGRPATAHWGVPDPAAVQGSDDDKARAFMATAITLKRRIGLMLALPDSLEPLALQRELRLIGER